MTYVRVQREVYARFMRGLCEVYEMGMRQDEIGEKTGWNVSGRGSEEVVVVRMCLSLDGKMFISSVPPKLIFFL